MVTVIVNVAWALYLGFMLAVVGYSLKTWQFWAIIIPVAILVELKVRHQVP